MANRGSHVSRLPSGVARNAAPILIAVLGVTGAGKSTFINKATGTNGMKVGHSIFSCTQQVSCTNVTIDGRNVVLIDTPGFDDTERSDADVLSEIATWLSESYAHDMLLNGIIMLQPVDGNRAYGSELRRTRLFRQICGPDAFSHVIIGTTMWSKLRHKQEGVKRVQERKESKDFWLGLQNHGAQVVEHQDTRESAQNIIRKLMNRGKTTLQLQEELVESNGQIFETSAGQQLFEDLGHSSARENEKLQQILREMKYMRESNEKYQQEIAELKNKIHMLQSQRTKLEVQKIPIMRSAAPQWITALATCGTMTLGAAPIVIPLAAAGMCTIL